MAEEHKQQKPEKNEKGKQEKQKPKEEKKQIKKEELTEALVRIMGFDIPTSKNIYTGLTRIKGISWAISNFVCLKMGYPRSKKIAELSKEDIKKLEEFLRKLPSPDFMKNRRFDRETGESSHYYGVDLDLKRDFDIKRLKQIKSYKGLRHALKQPVRGQKTRSHSRSKNKTAVGVRRKKEGEK